MMKPQEDAAELLTIEDAGKLLNLKISRIRMAVFRREVKYIKLGALIRFKKDHLMEWINSCTILATR